MSRTLRVALLAILAALCAAAPAAAKPAYDADTVIVKYRSSASGAALSALADRAGTGRTVSSLRKLGADVVRVDGDPAAVAARLERSPLVAYAEPNYTLRAQAVPNDPLFGEYSFRRTAPPRSRMALAARGLTSIRP